MGYAQRVHLNMARVFLAYKSWLADKPRYRVNIRDFVRTAYAHGVGTMFVIVDGPGGMMPGVFEDAAKPGLREYAKDLYDTVGQEPGLAI